MIIPVDDPFRPHADAALVRLRYLHPKADFALTSRGIEIAGAAGDPETLTREIHYALYREKIYAETLPMRRALIDMVTRR